MFLFFFHNIGLNAANSCAGITHLQHHEKVTWDAFAVGSASKWIRVSTHPDLASVNRDPALVVPSNLCECTATQARKECVRVGRPIVTAFKHQFWKKYMQHGDAIRQQKTLNPWHSLPRDHYLIQNSTCIKLRTKRRPGNKLPDALGPGVSNPSHVCLSRSLSSSKRASMATCTGHPPIKLLAVHFPYLPAIALANTL